MAEEETSEEIGIHEALQNAIHTIITTNGELPVKWFTLIDVITKDGVRAIYTLYSEDLPPWDKKAMLIYATAKVNYELSNFFVEGEYFEEDDEDD